ncbi:hypothetical protein HZC53_00855 [Candidatus Uhrbacteria bacterium]|nr:hypothetical protein [Candidatus Uhrbacteria bacterium]
MSLFIFLDGKAYEESTKTLVGERANRMARFRGLIVRLDTDGRLYYEVKNEHGPVASLVPIPLRDRIEAISWQTFMPPDSPTQKVGRYVHQTAEAIVDHRNDRQGWKTMRISGPRIEHVYALYHQLRAGKAELTEEWQAPKTQEAPTETKAIAKVPTGVPLKMTCTKCKSKMVMPGDKVFAGVTYRVKCRRCGNIVEASSDGTVKQDAKNPCKPN